MKNWVLEEECVFDKFLTLVAGIRFASITVFSSTKHNEGENDVFKINSSVLNFVNGTYI